MLHNILFGISVRTIHFFRKPDQVARQQAWDLHKQTKTVEPVGEAMERRCAQMQRVSVRQFMLSALGAAPSHRCALT